MQLPSYKRQKISFVLYSILLYMKKNTVNHSNKSMLIYFFRAVFINLYFKTKHSNETFHLGFYPLSNVFSYRKHISSKSNASVLTIFSKSRNIPLPLILWCSLNISWGSFYYDLWPLYFKIFFWNTHPLLIRSTPTIKHRRVNAIGHVRQKQYISEVHYQWTVCNSCYTDWTWDTRISGWENRTWGMSFIWCWHWCHKLSVQSSLKYLTTEISENKDLLA